MSVRWIGRDLVTAPLSIGLCMDEESFKKCLKRLKIPLHECDPWIPDDSDGKMWEFREVPGCHNRCCIICIRKKKSSTEIGMIGLIVHESIHVWQTIKELMNERYPSSEFEAYSIQIIVQRLISEYKLIQKERRKKCSGSD